MSTIRSAVLVFGLSVVLASSASAECTWVLWTQNPSYNALKGNASDAWSYVPGGGPDVFDTRAECEQALVRLDTIRLKALKDAKESGYKSMAEGVFYKCLPDTVDPRGAKGK